MTFQPVRLNRKNQQNVALLRQASADSICLAFMYSTKSRPNRC